MPTWFSLLSRNLICSLCLANAPIELCKDLTQISNPWLPQYLPHTTPFLDQTSPSLIHNCLGRSILSSDSNVCIKEGYPLMLLENHLKPQFVASQTSASSRKQWERVPNSPSLSAHLQPSKFPSKFVSMSLNSNFLGYTSHKQQYRSLSSVDLHARMREWGLTPRDMRKWLKRQMTLLLTLE